MPLVILLLPLSRALAASGSLQSKYSDLPFQPILNQIAAASAAAASVGTLPQVAGAAVAYASVRCSVLFGLVAMAVRSRSGEL
jgi:hypothetical protein